MNEPRRLLLIDLSAIFFPAYHAFSESVSSETISATMRGIERCQKMVPDSDVVICVDSKTNWRKKLAPTYKANREKAPSALYGMLDTVKQKLLDSGHLLTTAEGYEADDVIFTYVTTAKDRGIPVVIASHDKDLLALIDDSQNVRCLRTATWVEVGSREVMEKFGVMPTSIPDFLALCGDTSDGIAGCPGIGPKTAAKLLTDRGSIAGIYKWIDDGETVTTPKNQENLLASRDAVMLARQLVEMKFIPDIDFDEIYRPRETAAAKKGMPKMDDDDIDFDEKNKTTTVYFSDPAISSPPIKKEPETFAHLGAQVFNSPTPAKTPEQKVQEVFPKATVVQTSSSTPVDGASVNAPAAQSVSAAKATVPKAETALAVVQPDYKLALEPTSLARAFDLAGVLFESKLYQQFTSPQAIAAVIIRGRELGLGALASLSAFHVVEGRPYASANLIIAMAKADPDCEYFYQLECDDKHSTWVTKNRKNPGETRYTYTIEMARLAGLLDKPLSNWNRRPQEMCTKTAGGKLARIEYTMSAMGLNSLEESDNE